MHVRNHRDIKGGIMTRTRLIRWALTGISVAIAALLIGFTSSSAIAATHVNANAQQSHPIAATTVAIDFAGVAPAGVRPNYHPPNPYHHPYPPYHHPYPPYHHPYPYHPYHPYHPHHPYHPYHHNM
jgi:hypothetical protein